MSTPCKCGRSMHPPCAICECEMDLAAEGRLVELKERKVETKKQTKPIYSILLGVVITYGIMHQVYGALVDVDGLAQLAASGYRLGCVEAKGQDCPKKTEKYRAWVKKVMELL